MSSEATTNNTGVSVTRVKRVIDLIRGKGVDEALDILRFLPSPAATHVAKVVKSASANAENETVSNSAALRIVEIYANEASPLKRFRARARGRVSKILRRSSNITVVVEAEEAERG